MNIPNHGAFFPIVCLWVLVFGLRTALGADALSIESGTNAPILQRLQGEWQGVVQGDPSRTKYTVKVDGTSFYFHRDSNFWFETSIAAPKGSGPQQLQATIKRSAKGQESSLGKTVVALVKIERDLLFLAARGDGSDEVPETFDSGADKGTTLYELKKVRPQVPAIAPRQVPH